MSSSPRDTVDPWTGATVLLWIPRGSRVPGGHVVQMESTARALAATGLEVRTARDPDPDTSGVDLVHGFGLDPADIRRWHTVGVPVVLSPIYWDQSYRVTGAARRTGPRAVAGRTMRAARFAQSALRGRLDLLHASLAFAESELKALAAFEAADLLLPNARGEEESIRSDLGVSTPMVPVPNGVEPSLFAEHDLPFEDRRTVLYAGRIEPHKNQLGLIRALRGTGLPLVIVGPEHPDHPGYARRCRSEASGSVTFTGPVPHDELTDFYRSARVHVLPSWFETTGLVSLEAALSGCSVVSTSRGHAREYLADLAWYCDPADPASIADAVRTAWDTPPSPHLRERVLGRYTMRHVAEATRAAYATLHDRDRIVHRNGPGAGRGPSPGVEEASDGLQSTPNPEDCER